MGRENVGAVVPWFSSGTVFSVFDELSQFVSQVEKTRFTKTSGQLSRPTKVI